MTALFITIYLCANVMLFPWALRVGGIKWWFLSIIVLFIGLALWTKVHINKTKDNIFASRKINVYAENSSNEEDIQPIDDVYLESLIDRDEEIHRLPIDELIDLGFKEKNLENFDQAAYYFSYALSQDPIPDLAFSLIMDCYWLWDDLGKRDYALTQLQTYVQKYLPLFNAELRLQFDTWMVKEDLQIMLE